MNVWFCQVCNKPLEPKEYYCDPCREQLLAYKPKEQLPAMIGKVNLRGYGNVSEKRLKELDRRVMLPDKDPNGGYFVGRKGENGKIQDKEPTY